MGERTVGWPLQFKAYSTNQDLFLKCILVTVEVLMKLATSTRWENFMQSLALKRSG